MKRILSIGFIVAYLAALNYGNVCHMLGFRTGAHPMMYFIVWDMFCGWAAYDSRTHIIAEGESGKFYELTPAPWEELQPWGYLGRQHYDAFNNHSGKLGLNTLRHTQHEPIVRMFTIEETWAKKYNIPDNLWQARYDEPKSPQKYYRLRSVFLPDGTVVQSQGTWLQYQSELMLADNPRLKKDVQRNRSIFMVTPEQPGRDVLVGPSAETQPRMPWNPTVGAPLGN
ncbi:MAG: hypothetical protein ACKV0T_25275 [Planctomycetales bacterium]